MSIKILALTIAIQLTATMKSTSSAFGCHYGQASRYLVGLMAVGHKNDSKQHAISDSEGNSSKIPQPQTMSSKFVINKQ